MKEIKEKSLALQQKFQEEADERGTDYESSESEEDENEKWDAETILSTFTNTDNHPSVIKFVPKVKTNQKMKIELHKQFKVPVDGLNGLIPIAEEVIVKKKKKNSNKAFEEDTSSEEDDEDNEEDQKDEGEKAEGDDKDDEIKEINPRKAAKKLMKAEKR
jgi:protein LTV1